MTPEPFEIEYSPELKPFGKRATTIASGMIILTFLAAFFEHASLMSILWALFMFCAGIFMFIVYFVSETGTWPTDAIDALKKADDATDKPQPKSQLWPYAQEFIYVGELPFHFKLGRDASPCFVYAGERLTLDTFPQNIHNAELMLVTADGKHILVPAKLLEATDK